MVGAIAHNLGSDGPVFIKSLRLLAKFEIAFSRIYARIFNVFIFIKAMNIDKKNH